MDTSPALSIDTSVPKRNLLSASPYRPLPNCPSSRSTSGTDSIDFAFTDNLLKVDLDVCHTVYRKKPIILVYGLITLAICTAIGCTAVYFGSKIAEDNRRHEIFVGPSADLENAIRAEFESLSSGTKHLASYVKLTPNCSTLDQEYMLHLREIQQWNPRLSYLEILPSYVLKYHLPASDDLLGRDYLELHNVQSKVEIQRTGLWFSIPTLNNMIGVVGSFASFSIWLPANSYEEDLGCNLQPTNCSDVCFNATSKMKYYGTVRSLVDMENWSSGRHAVLRTIRAKNIRVLIDVKEYQTEFSKFVETTFYSTDSLPRDKVSSRPVERTFEVSNLIWQIKMEPAEGWEPVWVPPVYAVVLLVSLLVAVASTWVLVAKFRHEILLKSMLPRKVIKHLETGKKTFAENFDNVTIFFSDIVNFTVISSELEPIKVVELLDGMYNLFDRIAHKHGVYKVETIGDAYMAVTGCPAAEDATTSALRMAYFSADVIAAVAGYHPECIGDRTLQIRVGLHSGPVVAGVVGAKMPRYCLFGDTVNTASRMESNSQAMRIHMSSATSGLLRNTLQYSSRDNFITGENTPLDLDSIGEEIKPGLFLECRGDTPIKGKGVMRTYWLNDYRTHKTIDSESDSSEKLTIFDGIMVQKKNVEECAV